MRINVLLILYVLFLSAALGQDGSNGKLDSLKAANPQGVRTIIKTNPGAIFWGAIPLITSEYRLLMEFVRGANQSSQFGISYLGKSVYLQAMEKDTVINPRREKLLINGFRLQGSYRFFFNEWMQLMGFSEHPIYAPTGFYLSPSVSYSTAKITNNFFNQYDMYVRVLHYHVSLLGGLQFVVLNKISFDVFTGLGYKQNLWFERNINGQVRQIDPPEGFDALPLYNSQVKISFGINFGYCF